MKILICYFSGTGNTWWLANEFKNLAEKDNHNVELQHIQHLSKFSWDNLMKSWSSADQIGIAHPIYGSDAPKFVKEFLEIIPTKIPADVLTTKKGFVFTTMDLFSGDGGLKLKKPLKEINVQLQVAYNFQMVSNLGTPVINYNPVKEKGLSRRKKRSLKRLKKVYRHIITGKKKLQNRFNLFGYIFGFTQRVFMGVIENNNYKHLGVDSDRCSECMFCVKNCPTDSIEFTDHKFTFKENCTACYRCYNFCPNQAITVFKRTANPKRHRQHKAFRKEKFY